MEILLAEQEKKLLCSAVTNQLISYVSRDHFHRIKEYKHLHKKFLPLPVRFSLENSDCALILFTL